MVRQPTFKILALGAFALTFFACCGDVAVAQNTFSYPPYGAVRGRMVSREGLLNSERYRWGGGLTPGGVTFLNHAVDAFAPAVIGLTAGRDVPDSARSRDSEGGLVMGTSRGRSMAEIWDEYTQAQQEANRLLADTAALAKNVLSTPPPKTEGGSDPSPVNSSDPKLQELLKKLGPNPFQGN